MNDSQTSPPAVRWLIGLTALMFCAWSGTQLFQAYSPHFKPGPNKRQIAAVAEKTLLAVADDLVEAKRDEQRVSPDWTQSLNPKAHKTILDGFQPVDAELQKVLTARNDAFYEDAFEGLRDGFDHGSDKLRRSRRPDDESAADYGAALGKNCAEAARMVREGAKYREFRDFLLESNYRASQNLIDALCRHRTRDEDRDWGRDNRDQGDRQDDRSFTGFRRGYLIGMEPRAKLHETSTPLNFAAMQFTAPDQIDPRDWHHIEDQGQMGSCQGHAQSSVCEMAYLIKTRGKIQFSRIFAYYASQEFDHIYQDNGSTLAGGLSAAKQFGSCPEEVMPYPNPVVYRNFIPASAKAAASPYKIRSHTVCHSYEDVYNCLASGRGGVEIGIRWPDEWMECDGILETYPGNVKPAGHAVCFLGYDRKTDGRGRKYLWMANSWGKRWGQGGWALVSPKAVDQMLLHQDTVMICLSDMSAKEQSPRDMGWIGDDAVFSKKPDQSEQPQKPERRQERAKTSKQMAT